ncbi:AI-2E family transporter [Cronobacter turicensis]|nr:AI-2E family transporter [Cronobacter turicensis]
MNSKEMSRAFFILILFIVSILFFNLVKPYLSAVLWAVILAVIFYPVKRRLCHMINGRNNIASLLTVVLICVLVFVPLAVVASSLVREFNTLYTDLQANDTTFPTLLADGVRILPDWAQQMLAENHLDSATAIQEKISGVALKGSQYVAGSIFLISRNTFSVVIGFGIMLYLLFFLLKDGSRLVAVVLNAVPLSDKVKQRLFRRFAAVARATVKGTVVVAIVQGLLGGVAFYFAGIGASILWGSLMAFLSLVPAVGAALIWVPAVIYLFTTGAIIKAVLLTAFFVVVVGLADNLLRPLLVGKDIRMPDWLILLSTLGGLEVYGINGFVVGPLIAALFVTCWNTFSAGPGRTRALPENKENGASEPDDR